MTDTPKPDWVQMDSILSTDGEEDVQIAAQKHSSGTKVVVLVLIFGLVSFTMQTITSVVTLGQAGRAETAAQEAKKSAERSEELALANEALLLEVKDLTEQRVTTAEDIQQIVLDVKRLIEQADLLTSEEARLESQRQLAATLNIVIQQADCNTRESFADVIDAAVAAGELPAGFLNVRCEQPPPPIPGSEDQPGG